jgi:uncharacterized membrane protein YhaH (DUF805 family)
MNLSTLLFSFTGRINRARFWLAALPQGVVGMLVVVLGIALRHIVDSDVATMIWSKPARGQGEIPARFFCTGGYNTLLIVKSSQA